MKSILKFFTSMMLVAVFAICAFATVGCGGSVLDDFEKVDPGTLPEKKTGVDYSPLKKYDTEITITVFGIDYSAIGNLPSDYPVGSGKKISPSNNAFVDAAKKYLNINLKFLTTLSSEKYSETLSTRIASNSLPDVFRVTDATTFETLKNGNLIADLGDTFYYLNEDLQSMYLNDLYKPALETCMEDGKLYAFPNVQNPYEQAQKIYIRKDWLDAVGMSTPKTYEELVEVAKAFRDNKVKIAALNPDGPKADQLVPIGITKSVDAVGNYTASGFFNIFGVQPDTFIEVDGELVSNNTSDEMKNALKELNSLYSQNLLAKEFYNETDTAVSNAIKSGKVGICSGMWHMASSPLQESVSNVDTPTAEWISIELPTYNSKESKPYVSRSLIEDYNCVNANCKHPEAIAKLCNLFYDMFYNNNAEETYGDACKAEGGFFYSWVPVKLWYTPYSIDSYKRLNKVFDELYNAGFRISDAKLKELATYEKSEEWNVFYDEISNDETYGPIFNQLWKRERDNGFRYGYPYMQALRAGKKNKDMTEFEKQGYGIYEQTVSATGGYAYVAELNDKKKQATFNEFYGTRTPAQQNYGEYLNSTMTTFYIKAIIGEKNLTSDWKSFVKDYAKNGGDSVLTQVNQWFKS